MYFQHFPDCSYNYSCLCTSSYSLISDLKLILDIKCNPDCNNDIHKSLLCIGSLIKKLEFLSPCEFHYSYLENKWFHSYLNDVLLLSMYSWLNLTCSVYIVDSCFSALAFNDFPFTFFKVKKKKNLPDNFSSKILFPLFVISWPI